MCKRRSPINMGNTTFLFSGGDVVAARYPNIGLDKIAIYKEGYRGITHIRFIIDADSKQITFKGPPNPEITSATLESLGLKPEPYQYREYGTHGEWRSAFRSPTPSWYQPEFFDRYLVSDISVPSNRLDYLKKIISEITCFGAQSDTQNLVPFVEAMYKEARRIASTTKEKEAANEICRKLAYVTTREQDRTGVTDSEALISRHLKERYPECLK